MGSRRVFELSGGRLCLDFANTVDHRPTERRRDLLETYSDLAAWARQARVVSSRDERRLLERAETAPGEASRVLTRARVLREALFVVFSQGARGSESALEAIQRELARAYRHPVLRPGRELEWNDDSRSLDRMLGPIVRSAVSVLTSKERDQVRVCRADNCDWLFLDESRSRSRQWCNMAVCGNRAKARRFYRRNRSLRRRGNRAARRSSETRGAPSRE